MAYWKATSEGREVITKEDVLWAKILQCQSHFLPQDVTQRDLPEANNETEPHRVLDEDEATAIEGLIQLMEKCRISDDYAKSVTSQLTFKEDLLKRSLNYFGM